MEKLRLNISLEFPQFFLYFPIDIGKTLFWMWVIQFFPFVICKPRNHILVITLCPLSPYAFASVFHLFNFPEEVFWVVKWFFFRLFLHLCIWNIILLFGRDILLEIEFVRRLWSISVLDFLNIRLYLFFFYFFGNTNIDFCLVLEEFIYCIKIYYHLLGDGIISLLWWVSGDFLPFWSSCLSVSWPELGSDWGSAILCSLTSFLFLVRFSLVIIFVL